MGGGREERNYHKIITKQHSCVTANLIDKLSLIVSDVDEAPMAYKDIHTVMAAQHDLVEVLAKFEPRIVRMADAREKPEN